MLHAMAKLDLTLGAVGVYLHSPLSQAIVKAGVAAEKERARQRTLDYDPATVEVKIDGEPLGFDGDYVAIVQANHSDWITGAGIDLADAYCTFTTTVLSSYVTHTHDGSKHDHLLNSDGSLGPVTRKHT